MEEEAVRDRLKVYIPSPSFCTDNAAMVGVVGYEYLKRGIHSDFSLNAFANLPL
jgi:N6-L-threonylcarbamoyladenine synthase